jgi:hypothetical protein
MAEATRWAIWLVAMAVSGARRLGFQTETSPQTAPSMAFQPQTALGKLKAVMTPMGPSGSHCSYMRCSGTLAGHGQAVELAGEADGEVGDVDGLLDLADALGPDLADLEGDQLAQGFEVLAELIADGPDDLASDGGGDAAPAVKARGGEGHGLLVGVGGVESHAGDGAAGGRVLAEDDAPLGRLVPDRLKDHAFVRVEPQLSKQVRTHGGV